MTTDPRQCPSCKRMIEPELRDGVPVWKWHGTLTLGGRNTMRPCPMAGRPIKERRSRLANAVQRAIRETRVEDPTGEPGDPDGAVLASDPFAGFRDPDDTYDESTNPSNGWRSPERD